PLGGDDAAEHGLDGGGGQDHRVDGANHPGQDRDLRFRPPDAGREAGVLLGLRPGHDRADVTRLARRLAALALPPLLVLGASAHAEWSVSLDAEAFKWQEQTEPTVKETGPRWGFSWEYEQLRPQGWQFAYRGQFRRGTVDYSGSFLFGGGPATARTEYTG